MTHVWHFIDTVFNGEDKITFLRGEASSSSSSKRKNKDRSIAAGLVKLPKCLKDMLDSILPIGDDNKKLQTVGFIHSGLQSYVVRENRPTKYITRIQKSRNYHLSSDISQFGTTVLPAIYIAWIIKDIVRNTYNTIQESNTHNILENQCCQQLRL
ncbi:hypothetical protein CU097_009214 [Rhizopus azygosporus]|uniref:Uncharacterized protein n=1 Tax=Rhizopus azygosporus TaxID=86630 RepID=A0A367JDF3_RHIAZ|nr:hypothetical protein CU097_009214 [Rhizopus azygosporus]